MQLDEFRSLLSRFHIRPNKVLGQNFLLSEKVLDQIVEAAQLTKDDTVLEIGPGLGFLTKRLAEKAGRVVAVEKDRKLCQALRKIFSTPSSSPPVLLRKIGGERKGVVEIVEGDALDIGLQKSEVRGQNSDSGSQIPASAIRSPSSDIRVPQSGYKLVANIPYYLTGKILQKFLSTPSQSPPISFASLGAGGEKKKKDFSPSRREGGEEEGVRSRPLLLVLLLQKEVAERIVAKPGRMSVLSVSVQFYSDPEIIDYVGKENFYPVPEVDSAIVRLTPSFISPYSPAGDRGRKRVGKRIDERKFFQLVKIGFSNRRKQLQNNLTAGLRPAVIPAKAGIQGMDPRLRGDDKEKGSGDKSSEDYKQLLHSLGLNPLCRAQDLSLEDWKNLYNRLFTPSSISPYPSASGGRNRGRKRGGEI